MKETEITNHVAAIAVPGGLLFRTVVHGEPHMGSRAIATALQFVPCNEEAARQYLRDNERNE